MSSSAAVAGVEVRVEDVAVDVLGRGGSVVRVEDVLGIGTVSVSRDIEPVLTVAVPVDIHLGVIRETDAVEVAVAVVPVVAVVHAVAVVVRDPVTDERGVGVDVGVVVVAVAAVCDPELIRRPAEQRLGQHVPEPVPVGVVEQGELAPVRGRRVGVVGQAATVLVRLVGVTQFLCRRIDVGVGVVAVRGGERLPPLRAGLFAARDPRELRGVSVTVRVQVPHDRGARLGRVAGLVPDGGGVLHVHRVGFDLGDRLGDGPGHDLRIGVASREGQEGDQVAHVDLSVRGV